MDYGDGTEDRPWTLAEAESNEVTKRQLVQYLLQVVCSECHPLSRDLLPQLYTICCRWLHKRSRFGTASTPNFQNSAQ